MKQKSSSCQAGQIPILVLVGVILFTPLPKYQQTWCNEMYPPACYPAGWKLGFSIWDQLSGKATKTTQQPIPSPKPSFFSNVDNSDETRDWTIYTAEQFSIHYPAEWKVTSQRDKHFEFRSSDFKDDGYYELVGGIRIYINTPSDYPYGNTIDTYAEKLFLDCAKTEKMEDIYIGGYKARKYKTFCQGSDPNTTDILIDRKGEIYWIGYSYQPSHDISYLKTIDQILSTFKFLDQNDTTGKIRYDTKDWKIYTNYQYGFEIQYPQTIITKELGPNVAQQQLNLGKTISGTVQPSLDTIVFSNKDGVKQFEIIIFPLRNIEITPASYKTSLYLYGPCDLRFINSKPISIVVANFYDLKAIKVNVAESNKYLSCSYFKNKSGNLLVLSTNQFTDKQRFDIEDVTISNVLSTFKFLD